MTDPTAGSVDFQELDYLTNDLGGDGEDEGQSKDTSDGESPAHSLGSFISNQDSNPVRHQEDRDNSFENSDVDDLKIYLESKERLGEHDLPLGGNNEANGFGLERNADRQHYVSKQSPEEDDDVVVAFNENSDACCFPLSDANCLDFC